MLKTNKLKQKLLQGETVIGTFIKSTDPAVTEVLCMSGLDFVIIEKTLRAGKVVGTVASDGIAAKKLMDKGVRFIVMSSDLGMAAGSAKRMLGEFRA